MIQKEKLNAKQMEVFTDKINSIILLYNDCKRYEAPREHWDNVQEGLNKALSNLKFIKDYLENIRNKT